MGNYSWKHYDSWLDSVMEEFLTSEWYEDEYGNNFEICENGDVHFDNFHYIKGAVTSYRDWLEMERTWKHLPLY